MEIHRHLPCELVALRSTCSPTGTSRSRPLRPRYMHRFDSPPHHCKLEPRLIRRSVLTLVQFHNHAGATVCPSSRPALMMECSVPYLNGPRSQESGDQPETKATLGNIRPVSMHTVRNAVAKTESLVPAISGLVWITTATVPKTGGVLVSSREESLEPSDGCGTRCATALHDFTTKWRM